MGSVQRLSTLNGPRITTANQKRKAELRTKPGKKTKKIHWNGGGHEQEEVAYHLLVEMSSQ
jgi:hypothetical protein